MTISRRSFKNVMYKIQSNFFRFVGDIKCSGWQHPFWFTINAKNYLLKGYHYREVEGLIQPGDILIRRFEGYVDKWFIPGWWNHAGIYIGDNKVVHAISEGVIQEDLIDFMRTDHMIILRLKKTLVELQIQRGQTSLTQDAIELAKALVGREYDFSFDFADTNKFSCTEVVAYCYPTFIRGKKRFGRYSVVADDIVNQTHWYDPAINLLDNVGIVPFKSVWDSRNENSNSRK